MCNVILENHLPKIMESSIMHVLHFQQIIQESEFKCENYDLVSISSSYYE